MTQTYSPSDAVADIRARLTHPVIDADAHHLEVAPVVTDFLHDVGGADLAAEFARIAPTFTGAAGSTRGPTPREIAARAAGGGDGSGHFMGFGKFRGFWGFATRNVLDRVTSMAPALLYRRLDEIGIDFALLYPTIGLACLGMQHDDLRRALARALNRSYAELYSGYRDRLEPVAVIPMHTPDEALAELDHAVGQLGLKTVVMGGVIGRSIELPDGGRYDWLDTLGHCSLYDYDPVWQRCVELGVAPAFHSVGLGWGTRCSPVNWVYNHVGHFAAAQESTCRSLIMGGVPKRFPELRFSFLEGGVAWACQLYADLLGHWEKRNRVDVRRYDPAELDISRYRELLGEHGSEHVVNRLDAIVAEAEAAAAASRRDENEATIDDFAEAGIDGPQDITDVFRRQYAFGCEADDPLTSIAFDRSLHEGGIGLKAMFASDIGHFDVPDMRNVLPEAWAMVEKGHLSEAQFGEFTCTNVGATLTALNPSFFNGTAIEGRLPEEVAREH